MPTLRLHVLVNLIGKFWFDIKEKLVNILEVQWSIAPIGPRCMGLNVFSFGEAKVVTKSLCLNGITHFLLHG